MILPNANCVFFLQAAATEAANSGKDVPQAIKVNEIIASLTPQDLAITIALSTKKSQLVINNAKPPIIFNSATHKDKMGSLTSTGASSVVVCC